jgi:hypothetical protein
MKCFYYIISLPVDNFLSGSTDIGRPSVNVTHTFFVVTAGGGSKLVLFSGAPRYEKALPTIIRLALKKFPGSNTRAYWSIILA